LVFLCNAEDVCMNNSMDFDIKNKNIILNKLNRIKHLTNDLCNYIENLPRRRNNPSQKKNLTI